MEEKLTSAPGFVGPERREQLPGFVRSAVLRIMLREYATLQQVATCPFSTATLTPSESDGIEFLLSKELIQIDGQTATITDRGRQVLATEPLSRTAYTVAFDRNVLGW